MKRRALRARVAAYRCSHCGHRWSQPRPDPNRTLCPKCQSLYFQWLNPQQWPVQVPEYRPKETHADP